MQPTFYPAAAENGRVSLLSGFWWQETEITFGLFQFFEIEFLESMVINGPTKD